MSRITAEQAGNPNLRAFLDMIARSEGTAGHGDDGYNVMVGGGLFQSYACHPAARVWLPQYGIFSSAAGRYQFLASTWHDVAERLKLADFEPVSQDLGAIQRIRDRGAYDDVRAGRFDIAVGKCAKEWASLPGAGYGQHEQRLEFLAQVYERAGGAIA